MNFDMCNVYFLKKKSYLCSRRPRQLDKLSQFTINMAKPIRTIPTLFGDEAKKFESQANRVEANPGTIRIPKRDIELVRNVLRNIGM